MSMSESKWDYLVGNKSNTDIWSPIRIFSTDLFVRSLLLSYFKFCIYGIFLFLTNTHTRTHTHTHTHIYIYIHPLVVSVWKYYFFFGWKRMFRQMLATDNRTHVKFNQNCWWFMGSVRKFTCDLMSNSFTNNLYTNLKSKFSQKF
jgi:hypothetical protein